MIGDIFICHRFFNLGAAAVLLQYVIAFAYLGAAVLRYPAAAAAAAAMRYLLLSSAKFLHHQAAPLGPLRRPPPAALARTPNVVGEKMLLLACMAYPPGTVRTLLESSWWSVELAASLYLLMSQDL